MAGRKCTFTQHRSEETRENQRRSVLETGESSLSGGGHVHWLTGAQEMFVLVMDTHLLLRVFTKLILTSGMVVWQWLGLEEERKTFF